MTPKHILVATDLTDNSLPALEMALGLAAALSARVTLAHAVEPIAAPPGLDAYALEGLPLDWEQRLERGRFEAVQKQLAELLQAQGTEAAAADSKVLFGPLPGALFEAVKELGADLLIIGTHGRSGVARFFLGSVAEKVVRGAPCPVLTVRPRG